MVNGHGTCDEPGLSEMTNVREQLLLRIHTVCLIAYVQLGDLTRGASASL